MPISSSVTGVAFKELDIALKKVAKEQEDAAVSVEVTIPRKNRRARSLSRNNTETLPDEVTFSSFFLLTLFIHDNWYVTNT